MSRGVQARNFGVAASDDGATGYRRPCGWRRSRDKLATDIPKADVDGRAGDGNTAGRMNQLCTKVSTFTGSLRQWWGPGVAALTTGSPSTRRPLWRIFYRSRSVAILFHSGAMQCLSCNVQLDPGMKRLDNFQVLTGSNSRAKRDLGLGADQGSVSEDICAERVLAPEPDISSLASDAEGPRESSYVTGRSLCRPEPVAWLGALSYCSRRLASERFALNVTAKRQDILDLQRRHLVDLVEPVAVVLLGEEPVVGELHEIALDQAQHRLGLCTGHEVVLARVS